MSTVAFKKTWPVGIQSGFLRPLLPSLLGVGSWTKNLWTSKCLEHVQHHLATTKYGHVSFLKFLFEIPVYTTPSTNDQPVGVPVQDTHHEKHPLSLSTVKKLTLSPKTPTYVTQHLSLKYHFFRGVFPVFSTLGHRWPLHSTSCWAPTLSRINSSATWQQR